MKSEKTGAGIFKVGEKTIPTVISYLEMYGLTISNRHLVLLGSCDDSFEMITHDTQ